MGFWFLITHLVVPRSDLSFMRTGFSSLQLETILTSQRELPGTRGQVRTYQNLHEPTHSPALFFCFISSVTKLFSAEVLTEVKQNILPWFLYTCIFHFLLLRPHILCITYFPFCKQFRFNVQLWFWKNCFPWEKSSNRSRIHSCLPQWFPVLQQLNFLFPQEMKNFCEFTVKLK